MSGDDGNFKTRSERSSENVEEKTVGPLGAGTVETSKESDGIELQWGIEEFVNDS